MKQKLCDLCKHFYEKGWASGTGGGVSIKISNNTALVAPSGVQKEDIQPDSLFLIQLDLAIPLGYQIIESPNNFKISACTNIFANIYNTKLFVNSIIHSHSLNAVLLTKITQNKEVVISKYEMLKGITGITYSNTHIVPTLDNVEHECDLADDISKIIIDYPKSFAVLIRDHGFYVWGETWEKAKIHAECYDYLFAALVQETLFLRNTSSLKSFIH